MYRWADVEYEGLIFEVSGEWEPYQKATDDEPEEGGCFSEWDITIDGVSIFEMLTPKVSKMLLETAEDILRRMD